MEKVNVYDWDKTIFPVDSTVAFVRWCLRRHPGVIWPLLRTLALLPGYWLGRVSKTAIKERMYDKINVSVRTMDIFIGCMCVLFVVVVIRGMLK